MVKALQSYFYFIQVLLFTPFISALILKDPDPKLPFMPPQQIIAKGFIDGLSRFLSVLFVKPN